jgi:glycosyltransferase involved in cell wall biosynthesis
MIEGYIPKEQRKTILLLSDDLQSFSGVANMSKEIVYGTAHKYNWIQLGSGVNHPYKGQKIDISPNVNKSAGIEDSSVNVIPWDGYGDANIIRHIMKVEKPDAIMIFTDPRQFEWLFAIENEVRKICPIIYYNIWDSTPAPLWNKKFYESCDALFGISKQTVNINKIVLGDLCKDKIIKYIAHGINENIFKPLLFEDSNLIKHELFEGKDPKFVAFFNSRNIRRKCIPDLLAAWQLFQKTLTFDQQQDTALLLHTDPIDQNGTNLFAVREALFGIESNVYFTKGKMDVNNINVLYNIANVTILPSSAEGWGLSLTESLMTGTPIIANVTGGMQDQMRFEGEDGEWINFDDEFLSNHFGKYQKCGNWAKPVFPNNISLVGSVQTPYIYDDRLDFRDLFRAIEEIYYVSPEDLKKRGLEGRDWVLSDESGMSAKNMCKNMIEGIDETLLKFIPKKSFSLIETNYEIKKLNHNLIY